MAGYISFFRKTLGKWVMDDGITNSAALSFHVVIGLPSLLLFVLFLGSIFLKKQLLEAAIITGVSVFADDHAISALNLLFTQLSVSTTINFGIVLSFLVYLWSAGNIFIQLQKMINKMWGSKATEDSWLHHFVRSRASALAATLVFGMLVAISTLFEVIFFAISDALGVIFSLSVNMIQLASFGFNFLILIALFMYLFRVLPERNPGLRYVFTGALLTVVLLTIAKYLMGFYLHYSNITTVYGTIGSILVIFLWVYMSSIIVTFMAEFIGVISDSV